MRMPPVLMLILLFAGCPNPTSLGNNPNALPPVEDLPLDPDGLAAALTLCPDIEAPCLLLAQAHAESLAVDPIVEGSSLGVFNAGQGGVATWVTLIAHNVPLSNPTTWVALTTGPTAHNLPGTLKVPFNEVGDGSVARTQFMVQFMTPCCAQDFVDLPAQIEVHATWDDCEGLGSPCGDACENDESCPAGYLCEEAECRLDTLVLQIPILLNEAPWPL